MPLEKFCLTRAGFSGLTAVGFGAFGAHSLKDHVAGLPPEEAARILGWVETGSKYQLAHAAALLALGALAPRLAPGPAKAAAQGLFWGSFIFALTLYAMALGAPHWLGAVTPAGGVLMLLGWMNVFRAGRG
jgi:uncharacterized membrane protein YgdD (TMEM256/DUF423 family)